jgi:hypothetical protein
VRRAVAGLYGSLRVWQGVPAAPGQCLDQRCVLTRALLRRRFVVLRRQDPFSRKDWYDVKAPIMFTNRQVGKTLVTRTTGTKIASEGLKGRVIEASLADLNQARGWTGCLSGPTLGPEPTKTGTDARPRFPPRVRLLRTRTRRSAKLSCALRTCRARTA